MHWRDRRGELAIAASMPASRPRLALQKRRPEKERSSPNLIPTNPATTAEKEWCDPQLKEGFREGGAADRSKPQCFELAIRRNANRVTTNAIGKAMVAMSNVA